MCLALLALLLTLAACMTSQATPTVVPTPTATTPRVAGLTPTATATPGAGGTPAATLSAAPVVTLAATRTPQTILPPATRTATPSPAAVVFDVTGSGGAICHATTGGGEQCSPAAVQGGATAGDRITANAAPDGTVGLSAQAAKFRLLPGSQMRLKPRSDLSAPEIFVLEAGEALFDHQNSAGEIVVEVGGLRVQPVDTQFCVVIDPDGKAVVGVFGPGSVLITQANGTAAPVAAIGDNQQFDYARPAPTPPGSVVPGTPTPVVVPLHPLDPELRALWTTYGVVAPEPTDTPTPTATQAPVKTAPPAATATSTPTATPLDTTPPVIANVRAVPTAIGYGACGTTGGDVQISATVRDAGGVARVLLVYNYRGAAPAATPGPAHTLTMIPPLGVLRLPTYSALVPVSREAFAELHGAAGTLEYTIFADDTRGNQATGKPSRVPIYYCNPIR